jgi:hypothetical protein
MTNPLYLRTIGLFEQVPIAGVEIRRSSHLLLHI